MAYQLTRLRLCRLDRSLTVFDLGGRAQISPGRLAAIEEGWVRPTADEVNRLASALGTTSEALTRRVCDTVDIAPLRVAPAPTPSKATRTRKGAA